MSEALSTLAAGGSLITLGYSGGRKATIDVTDLIWKRATIKSFALFAQPPAAWEEAWNTIVPLLQCGRIKPIVAKAFSLAEASELCATLSRAAHSASSYSPSNDSDVAAMGAAVKSTHDPRVSAAGSSRRTRNRREIKKCGAWKPSV